MESTKGRLRVSQTRSCMLVRSVAWPLESHAVFNSENPTAFRVAVHGVGFSTMHCGNMHCDIVMQRQYCIAEVLWGYHFYPKVTPLCSSLLVRITNSASSIWNANGRQPQSLSHFTDTRIRVVCLHRLPYYLIFRPFQPFLRSFG